MACRLRMISVLAFLGATGSMLHGQSLRPGVAEKLAFMDSTRASATLNGTASAGQAADRYYAAAEARLHANQPWSSDLYQEAALKYLAANDHGRAVASYRKLEADAESATWKAYAGFRVGELLLNDGDTAGAREAFLRSVTAIQAGAIENDLALYVRATLGRASCERALGNRGEAISVRAGLLGKPWTARIAPEQHASIYVESARDCFASQDAQAGQAWIDSLFSSNPRFGAEDGRAISLRVERALGGRKLGDIRDMQTAQELLVLWNDPQNSSQPETMSCASKIVTIYENMKKFAEAEQICTVSRQRYDQHEASWRRLEERRRFDRAAEHYQAVVIEHIRFLRKAEQWAAVRATANDLLQRFPSTQFRQIAVEAIQEAQQHLP